MRRLRGADRRPDRRGRADRRPRAGRAAAPGGRGRARARSARRGRRLARARAGGAAAARGPGGACCSSSAPPSCASARPEAVDHLATAVELSRASRELLADRRSPARQRADHRRGTPDRAVAAIEAAIDDRRAGRSRAGAPARGRDLRRTRSRPASRPAPGRRGGWSATASSPGATPGRAPGAGEPRVRARQGERVGGGGGGLSRGGARRRAAAGRPAGGHRRARLYFDLVARPARHRTRSTPPTPASSRCSPSARAQASIPALAFLTGRRGLGRPATRGGGGGRGRRAHGARAADRSRHPARGAVRARPAHRGADRGRRARRRRAASCATAGSATRSRRAPTSNLLLEARGLLRLAQGRTREGVDDLLEFGRRDELWGGREPARLALALARRARARRDRATREQAHADGRSRTSSGRAAGARRAGSASRCGRPR